MTRALTATVAIAWVAQLALGWQEGQPNLTLALRLGANFGVLVQQGEIERLVTANWLHGYWFHVILNAMGLFFLGRAVEPVLGGRSLLLVYLCACLGGALGSAFSVLDMPSMGASTGVAGLFAALGVVLFNFQPQAGTPAATRFARVRRTWLILLSLQISLEVLTETPWNPFPGIRIDHAGHLGGFFAGGAVAWMAVFAGAGQRETGSFWKSFLAIALTALFVAAFGVRFYRNTSGSEASLTALVTRSKASNNAPAIQNLYAWEVALQPKASQALLTHAQELAARALDRHRTENVVEGGESARLAWWAERSAIADTLATLHFRLGHFDKAIAIERDAREAPVPLPQTLLDTTDSQLARFLCARRRANDGQLSESLPRLSRVAFELTRERPGSADRGTYKRYLPRLSRGGKPRSAQMRRAIERTATHRLWLSEVVQPPFELLALHENSEQDCSGLLRIVVPKRFPPQLSFLVAGPLPEGPLQVVLLDPSRAPNGITTPEARWIPMHPEVAAYP